MFISSNEGNSKTITNGIRVEVSFEQREKVLQVLYGLKWQASSYKQAMFIPFRANEKFNVGIQKTIHAETKLVFGYYKAESVPDEMS